MSFLYPRPATSCFNITSMFVYFIGLRLLERVANVWKQCQVTGTLNSLGDFLLKLQACTCKSARKDLALLVHKLQKEVRIFVVDILYTVLLKAAVFWLNLSALNGFIH